MSKRYVNLYNVFEKVKWLGMLISGLTIFLMMIYTCVDILLRYTLGTSNLTAYEFSQFYFMPLAIFPAIAYAFGTGVMPKIDIFIEKVKIKYQKILALTVIILEILVFFLLTIGGFRYTLYAVNSSHSFTAGGEDFILSPVIASVPIGFLMVLIELIFLLIKNIRENEVSFVVMKKE